ncbi:hypothetical protein [Sorangium sp. So ce1097]|uniref:hypothetical protein n=1 Tax=Sorangium sp. So ce1097 TaxID=3133330 RepID=UPI003F612E35
MKINIRDPKHRHSLTFPGKPIARRVSPDDIEAYLRAKGYRPAGSIARDWPRNIAFAWLPPEPPDPRAPPFPIRSRMVPGPRLCSQPLEPVVEAIAHNEKRTPGEVLREIAVMAQMAENGE